MKRKSMGTPSGFRDLMPKDVILKLWLLKNISDIYQKYGFLPIETPLVEFKETLASEVTDFNLYKVIPSKERKNGNASDLALRFDQTVPLARFVVDHLNEINLPFKRYVYGPVFRGETPQAGRYRQFDQFDVDIIGSSNLASDVEILLCMRDVMISIVGEGNFTIRTNTRKLLNVLPKIFNFPEENLQKVLIKLDKRDKISESELIESLIEIGLSEFTSKNIVKFGSIKGSPDFVLKEIKSYCGDLLEAKEAINDLTNVLDLLNTTKAKEVEFDISIIRGLGYYTGMVFETILNNAPHLGSVYSGGRYDDLVSSFGVKKYQQLVQVLELIDWCQYFNRLILKFRIRIKKL